MGDRPSTTRRDVLGTAAGVAGLASLAGCSALDGGDEEPGGTDGDGTADDEAPAPASGDDADGDESTTDDAGADTDGTDGDDGGSDGSADDGESTGDGDAGDDEGAADGTGDESTDELTVEALDSADAWTEHVEGDADVTVRAPDELDLRVHQCSRAAARRSVAEGAGRLRIAFEYTTEAEQWYESPGVALFVDGEERTPLGDDPDASVDVEDHSTVSGSVETTVDVAGDVELALRVEPSTHCDNLDHGNTYFRVRELEVEAV